MKNSWPEKIVIIGMGLMGGSLAAACQKKFSKTQIVGISRNAKALRFAKSKQWIHEGTKDVLAGAKDADLIVLCTPVSTYFPYLKAIDRVCSKNALVMDVGSVKAAISKEVNSRAWKNFSFVGCHPMVGSHRRGIQAVNPELYKDGLVLLTRERKTSAAHFVRAKQFWQRFTSHILTLTPEKHDALVGQISHLPHAIAFCLMHAVSRSSLRLASTGFRDTTRVAASDPSIWEPIFFSNSTVLLKSLNRFEKKLQKFKKLLTSKNSKKLVAFLESANRVRKSL